MGGYGGRNLERLFLRGLSVIDFKLCGGGKFYRLNEGRSEE